MEFRPYVYPIKGQYVGRSRMPEPTIIVNVKNFGTTPALDCHMDLFWHVEAWPPAEPVVSTGHAPHPNPAYEFPPGHDIALSSSAVLTPTELRGILQRTHVLVATVKISYRGPREIYETEMTVIGLGATFGSGYMHAYNGPGLDEPSSQMNRI